MDLGGFLAVVAGGSIALVAQVLTARTAQRTAQVQIDYERWDRWREQAADVWARVAEVARRLDQDFNEIADLDDLHLGQLREAAREAVLALDRLSALALPHQVSEWAAELAGLLTALDRRLPEHEGCDDEEAAAEYQRYRHLLHLRFEWNDGESSTQVERLRDALRAAADPPERHQPRRTWRLRTQRRRW